MKFLSLMLVTIFLSIGCSTSCQNNKKNLADDTVAKINGVNLLVKDLDNAHNRALSRFIRKDSPISENLKTNLRANILKKMIDDEIIKQESKKQNITIDRFERVEILDEFKTRMGGKFGFNYYLEINNLSEEELINNLVADRLREKLISHLLGNISIDEHEIKSYYEKNKNIFTIPKTARAKHILFRLEEDAPKEKEKLAYQKALNVLKMANNGRSFEELAKQYGEDVTKERGGDLGYFAEGQMVPTFNDAVFNGKLKTPIGPIKTDDGYHLIFVEEIVKSHLAKLDEVKEKIKQYITRDKLNQKMEDTLKTLRPKYDVAVYDYSLSQKDYSYGLN